MGVERSAGFPRRHEENAGEETAVHYYSSGWAEIGVGDSLALGIRIHQLAKQLGLESRALVDLCGELGLGTKTALSSLTEEEVAKVKEHLKSRSSRSVSPAAATATSSTLQPPKSLRDIAPPKTVPTFPKKVPTLERGKVAPKAPTPAQEVGQPSSEVGLVFPEIAPPPIIPPVAEAVEAAAGLAPPSAIPRVEPAVPPLPQGLPAPIPPTEVAEPPGGIQPPAEVVAGAIAPPSSPEAAPSIAAEQATGEIPVAPVPLVAPEVQPSEAAPSPPGVETPGTVLASPPAVEVVEPPQPERVGPAVPEPTAAKIEPPPVLPERKPRVEKADKVDSADRAMPGVIIAPIPQVQKGRQPPKQEQQPVLKPEIPLTPQALRSLKTTRRPLSEYLKRLHSPEKLAELEKAVEKLVAGEEAPPAEAAPTRPKPKERVKERVVEKEKPREKEREKEKEKAAPRPGREPAKPKRGYREEEEEDILVKEARPAKRKPLAPRDRTELEEEEEAPVAPAVPITLRRQKKGKSAVPTAPRKTSFVVELPCTVRSFSEAAGVPVHVVLGKLLGLGVMANINSSLDADLAELLAAELGLNLQVREEVDPEEKLRELYERPDDPTQLVPRAPVVTFLGHVDHGKTSLLDRILGTNVAARERGGITQHIRAYRILKDSRPITFVDTPGHEAFTAMRARGAQVTDIAVLVVACDDGVMPQTEEAIAHIRAAGVPMVVALNKVDLPGVKPERVLQQLAAVGVLPTEWGGDVEVVKTSAVTGQGIDELLEVLLTVAELHELKANPNRPAVGVCLEASVQAGRGVVAKLLVKKGTLRVGDVVLCGAAHGRIKAMYDTLNPDVRYEEAGPSMPVDVVGLDTPPEAGERFYVLEDVAEARKIAEQRAERDRAKELAGVRTHLSLEELSARLAQKERVEVLHLILRADVRGSLEAIQKEMSKLQHPEVKIEVLQAAVGAITEGDVELAHASDAIIIGFNVAPTDRALALAEQYGVEIRRYDIIYELTQDLKAALEGLLKPEIREVELGRAVVLKTFYISRVGTVAGCRVVQGVVTRDARIRVVRDGRVIGTYPVQSLRREKDDVREVREGFECGIKLANFDDVKEGDVLEAYRLEEVQRRLEEVN
ncbi:MAG: translation initiation factor IF-2 [Thermoguttaceae bacterium]|nr:translation initiation factor IF-2 [Thermoguttaceae bacterium]MDW8077485.1 translation initiation factor IF-2 [Thermoguttaceae bacterium]